MTELKSGTVLYCTKTDRDPDRYGNNSYNVSIKMSDNSTISGLFIGKKPEYFEPGKSVQFNHEEKLSQSGKTWNKISIPKKDAEYGGGGGSSPKDPTVKYRIARTVALKTSIKYITYTKSTEKLGLIAHSFLGFIESHSDTEGNAIAAQSAIDQAVESIHIKPMSELKEVLDVAQYYFDFIIKPKE
jgi:hypothetical protein